MQSAVEDSIGDNGGEFLERFKGYGWYLDDLVLIPVNRLEKSERLALCKSSQTVWQLELQSINGPPLSRF
jgi:hypothetical protein